MSDKSKIKHALLKSICSFHEFCEENNLEYFIIGGTLIGAIRHNGFIPWDDDIDVVMPAQDYKKLLSLKDKVNAPFELKSYESDSSYIYPFAKYSNDKLIVEEDFYKPFHSGVWIDIFPLTYTFDSVFAQKLHFSTVGFFRKLLILKHGSFKENNRHPLLIGISKVIHPVARLIPRGFFTLVFNSLESIPSSLFNLKTNYANLYGTWGLKEIAPEVLFKEKKLYEFEGVKLWGINNADAWLSKVYGDYMKLPPEDKRISEHVGRIVKEE